ncbi:N-acetylmuramoyl-L-alanine amidase [Armatimonas sp.]|uniref:N-acetylmuramoyl-L-alanine amidase family protein n=1 Tax=Armatimonas sp. TaxID=1872638 RepID=UPI00286A7653|nr:N-acetylmuramoyl-L-alanine amidase [Armatimonas sp.]
MTPPQKKPTAGAPSRRRRRRQNPALQRRWGDLSILLLFLTPVLLFLQCRHSSNDTVATPTPSPTGPLRNVIVVIDPGHGGADSGANRMGTSEAQLTYRMAATLGSVLQQAGAEIHLTVKSKALQFIPKEGAPELPLVPPRDARFTIDNKYVGVRQRESPEDLYRRAQLADKLWRTQGARKQVFFLSLHYDALSESRWHGGLICYDVRRGRPPQLANALANRWRTSGLAGQRRGDTPKARDLGVLNPEHNPVEQSVLIELATMSNVGDLNAARNATWRWKVARLIADAVESCVKN